MGDKKRDKTKRWLMPALGVTAFFAFLVMCSEPAPGEEVTMMAFTVKEVAALTVLGICVWGIRRLDGTKN